MNASRTSALWAVTAVMATTALSAATAMLLGACASSPSRQAARLPERGYVALAHYGTNPVIDTDEEAVVRVGLAADRASWGIVRYYLARGALPPAEAVRVEDCVQALAPAPELHGTDAFSVATTIMPSPFRAGWQTLLVAIATRPAGDVRDLTVVSEDPGGMLERALAERGARVVTGDVKALPAAFAAAEHVVFVSDAAGLGGPDAQGPLLAATADFAAHGGVMSVVERLDPGSDDALLDRLATLGGGTHELLVAGEERTLAAALMRAPALTNATAELHFDATLIARWRLVGHESRVATRPLAPRGGAIPGGDGVYLLLEVKPTALGLLAKAPLGTVDVVSNEGAWHGQLALNGGDAATHGAVVAIAAFAEKLRGSYWSHDIGWDALAGAVDGLAQPALRGELGGLVRKARSLAGDLGDGIERPVATTRSLP